MSEVHFLVVGKNQEILETLKRLIESTAEWHAVVVNDEAEVYRYLKEHQIDAVLLSSGLTETFETDIKQFVLTLATSTRVISHYGGGSGLLKNEIYSTFPHLIP